MGIFFNTRNNDGASGLCEPVNTIPARDQHGMRRVADYHGCDSLTELYSAPSLGHRDSYDPAQGEEN